MSAKTVSKVLFFMLASLILSISRTATVTAQETTDQEEAHRQAILTVAAEVNNGNFDIVNQVVAEDYVVHTPLGDMDRTGVIGLFTALSSALTDFEMVREQILVEGNFATSRFTFSGIFENDFVSPMGTFPPTGQPFKLEVINMFEFDDEGMIAEEWVQYDALNFLTQLGAMGSTAASAGGTITAEMATAFAERFDAIFDGPSLEIADEIFAPEFVAHLPLAPELDREGWKGYVASFYAGISDATEEVNQVIVGKDRVVLLVTYTGTHDGVLFGIPATGKSVSMEGIGIFSFDENGLATENWAVLDVVGVLAQIGAFPPAE